MELIRLREGRFRLERTLYTKTAAGGGTEATRDARLGALKPLKEGVGYRWKWTGSQGLDQRRT